MSAVRILFDSSHSTLHQQLQGWLAETAGQIEIIGISVDSNQYGHCLSILYELAAGPHYWGQVLFNSRHSMLEAAVNQSLSVQGAGRPDFIAHGANDYGHCLVLIGGAN